MFRSGLSKFIVFNESNLLALSRVVDKKYISTFDSINDGALYELDNIISFSSKLDLKRLAGKLPSGNIIHADKIQRVVELYPEVLKAELEWCKKNNKELFLENEIIKDKYIKYYASMRRMSDYINLRSINNKYIFFEFPPTNVLNEKIGAILKQRLPKVPIGTCSIQLYSLGNSRDHIEWRVDVFDRYTGQAFLSSVVDVSKSGWIELSFDDVVQSDANALEIQVHPVAVKGSPAAGNFPLALSNAITENLALIFPDNDKPLALRLLVGPPDAPSLRNCFDVFKSGVAKSKEKIFKSISVISEPDSKCVQKNSVNTAAYLISSISRQADIQIKIDKPQSFANDSLLIAIVDLEVGFKSEQGSNRVAVNFSTDNDLTSPDSGRVIESNDYYFESGWRISMTSKPIARSNFRSVIKITPQFEIRDAELRIHGIRLLEID